jgi:hypothetical protein
LTQEEGICSKENQYKINDAIKSTKEDLKNLRYHYFEKLSAFSENMKNEAKAREDFHLQVNSYFDTKSDVGCKIKELVDKRNALEEKSKRYDLANRQEQGIELKLNSIVDNLNTTREIQSETKKEVEGIKQKTIQIENQVRIGKHLTCRNVTMSWKLSMLEKLRNRYEIQSNRKRRRFHLSKSKFLN